MRFLDPFGAANILMYRLRDTERNVIGVHVSAIPKDIADKIKAKGCRCTTLGISSKKHIAAECIIYDFHQTRTLRAVRHRGCDVRSAAAFAQSRQCAFAAPLIASRAMPRKWRSRSRIWAYSNAKRCLCAPANSMRRRRREAELVQVEAQIGALRGVTGAKENVSVQRIRLAYLALVCVLLDVLSFGMFYFIFVRLCF